MIHCHEADENADGDGVCGDVDNCPGVSNANQANFDGDSLGDACDADDDNDMVPDVGDSVPTDPFVCADSDADGCDDCSSGTNAPGNDGVDTDGDGACNIGDCTPDDRIDLCNILAVLDGFQGLDPCCNN